MPLVPSSTAGSRPDRAFNRHGELRREDIILALDCIKQRLSDPDLDIGRLTPQRWVKNFHSFAEIAMTMIHRHGCVGQECDRIRAGLEEAGYGLWPEDR